MANKIELQSNENKDDNIIVYKNNMTVSMGEQWARNNGAPIEYLFAENPEKLIDLLAWKCDYIVIKLKDDSPRWQKNLLMKMRAAGKHGTIVR